MEAGVIMLTNFESVYINLNGDSFLNGVMLFMRKAHLIQFNQWYHGAVVNVGNDVVLYLNGEVDRTGIHEY